MINKTTLENFIAKVNSLSNLNDEDTEILAKLEDIAASCDEESYIDLDDTNRHSECVIWDNDEDIDIVIENNSYFFESCTNDEMSKIRKTKIDWNYVASMGITAGNEYILDCLLETKSELEEKRKEC